MLKEYGWDRRLACGNEDLMDRHIIGPKVCSCEDILRTIELIVAVSGKRLYALVELLCKTRHLRYLPAIV